METEQVLVWPLECLTAETFHVHQLVKATGLIAGVQILDGWSRDQWIEFSTWDIAAD